MKDITIRNPEQLGRAIRLKRQERTWSQKALAARLGVDRKWVIHLEAGHPKAEFGLVLQALNTLNLSAHLHDENQSHTPKEPQARPSRLDDVIGRLQRPERK